MATTSSPYGLRPFRLDGGSPLGLLQELTLTANSATAFFEGELVSVNAGVITPIGASPTTTRNANTPWGVFVGVNYFNAQGQLVNANTFPAGGFTSFTAFGPITMLISNNPELFFRVQADGPVALTAIGKNAAIKNFTGNATFGTSAVQLEAASVNTTNTLGFRIVGIVPGPGNLAGDAFTDVVITYNQNVHALRNILGV